MLRRAPTAITLTTEDITAYDDSRLARLAQNNSENVDPTKNSAEDFTQSGRQAMADPSDELKPLPGEKARVVRSGLSRDERIGVGR
ncbi:hypothetical protein MMC06_002910 [Schaereria dolodes]|nr:hypothetical protein [Schaereria dolodes]